jgi:hypothetical protein
MTGLWLCVIAVSQTSRKWKNPRKQVRLRMKKRLRKKDSRHPKMTPLKLVSDWLFSEVVRHDPTAVLAAVPRASRTGESAQGGQFIQPIFTPLVIGRLSPHRLQGGSRCVIDVTGSPALWNTSRAA